MKLKKIPMRTCVVTREKCEKRDLLRIVRTPEGTVEVDPTGKANGRGVYLKKDLTVLEKARKTNVIGRTLGVVIDENVYESIKQIITK